MRKVQREAEARRTLRPPVWACLGYGTDPISSVYCVALIAERIFSPMLSLTSSDLGPAPDYPRLLPGVRWWIQRTPRGKYVGVLAWEDLAIFRPRFSWPADLDVPKREMKRWSSGVRVVWDPVCLRYRIVTGSTVPALAPVVAMDSRAGLAVHAGIPERPGDPLPLVDRTGRLTGAVRARSIRFLESATGLSLEARNLKKKLFLRIVEVGGAKLLRARGYDRGPSSRLAGIAAVLASDPRGGRHG